MTRQRVERLLDQRVVRWVRVQRGDTEAARWLVACTNATSAFVKMGITPETAKGLRAAYRVYTLVSRAFMPRVIG